MSRGQLLDRIAVNYVSYGSNTNYNRLALYIEGGQAPGSSYRHEGCTDKTLPPPGQPIVLARELYFAVDPDDWWGGGTGFIGIEPSKEHTTLAVAYRLRPGQFTQIAAQEDGRGLKPLKVELEALRSIGHISLFPDRVYGELVYCGDDESGIPNLSFTRGLAVEPQDYQAPHPAYLRIIATGLMRAHGLSMQQAAEYFLAKAGIRDTMSLMDILGALSVPGDL